MADRSLDFVSTDSAYSPTNAPVVVLVDPGDPAITMGYSAQPLCAGDVLPLPPMPDGASMSLNDAAVTPYQINGPADVLPLTRMPDAAAMTPNLGMTTAQPSVGADAYPVTAMPDVGATSGRPTDDSKFSGDRTTLIPFNVTKGS